jgi:hypothetical protein
MATKILNIHYKAKNKTWSNLQTKQHEKGYKFSDQSTDRTQKSRTHLFKILNNLNMVCGEKRESSRVQVSLLNKKYKYILQANSD